MARSWGGRRRRRTWSRHPNVANAHAARTCRYHGIPSVAFGQFPSDAFGSSLESQTSAGGRAPWPASFTPTRGVRFSGARRHYGLSGVPRPRIVGDTLLYTTRRCSATRTRPAPIWSAWRSPSSQDGGGGDDRRKHLAAVPVLVATLTTISLRSASLITVWAQSAASRGEARIAPSSSALVSFATIFLPREKKKWGYVGQGYCGVRWPRIFVTAHRVGSAPSAADGDEGILAASIARALSAGCQNHRSPKVIRYGVVMSLPRTVVCAVRDRDSGEGHA